MDGGRRREGGRGSIWVDEVYFKSNTVMVLLLESVYFKSHTKMVLLLESVFF